MRYVIQKTATGSETHDIYSRLLKDRIVFIGPEHPDPQLASISASNSNMVVAQILYLMSDNKNQDINIYINSPGGSVTAGLAIYDTMQFVPCNIATYCLGPASSMGAVLLAIDIDSAKGDIRDSSSLRWVHRRCTSYVPSPLVYDGFLYFFRVNSGTLSCIDAKSGKVHYEGKRTGLRTVYASPVGAGGRVYLTAQEGKFKVIKLGKTYSEIATNSLDDIFDASPAIVGDALYLRGRKNLYCLAAGE